MRKQIYCLLSLLWISCLSVSAADRWVINPAGGITWQIDGRVPHEDHIEMSGLKVSTVLRSRCGRRLYAEQKYGMADAPHDSE